MWHRNPVRLHNFHQILHCLCHVDISHIQLAILDHQAADIFIQLTLIRFSPKFSQRKNRILDHPDIVDRNPLDRIGDQFSVSV